jgi:uncharacterized integral membrane protein (TIGR00697 family)
MLPVGQLELEPAPAPAPRVYKYYDLIMASFVTVLLCSNMIGPGKSCRIVVFGVPLVFGAGNLFFPISYIFGDVLTEVYGFAKSRKVIWAGFAAMAFAAIMSRIVILMPLNPAEPFNARMQPALEICFGNSFRIVAASMLAFWAGDFVNSVVMAKMKVATGGRLLWTRAVGSTVTGQAVDSVIFYPVAFSGIWSSQTVGRVIVFNWVFKVAVEIAFIPLTYKIVKALKRAENEDYFDRDTDFTPFSLQD